MRSDPDGVPYWYTIPAPVRAAVTTGLREARDEILKGLAEGLYPQAKGPWSDPQVVKEIYNAALRQLGANP